MLTCTSKRIRAASDRCRKGFALLGTLAAALLFLTACGSTATAPAPTTAGAPATGAGATTAGQLADQGKTVYSSNCASCHGAEGQGANAPALIGSKASLGKYNTAAGLFDFSKATMPKNKPGTLTADQYLQVVAYLLVQNNAVSSSAPLSQSNLNTVTLK